MIVMTKKVEVDEYKSMRFIIYSMGRRELDTLTFWSLRYILLLLRWIPEIGLDTEMSSLYLLLEPLLDLALSWVLLLFKSLSAAALNKSYLVILLGVLLRGVLSPLPLFLVTVFVRDDIGLTIKEETMERMNELLFLLLLLSEFSVSIGLARLAGVRSI